MLLLAKVKGGRAMEVQKRLYDVDDLWQLGLQDKNRDIDYELVDGAIVEMTKPGGQHGQLVIRMGRYLDIFVDENRLGYVTTETGYFPGDYRYTMLAPDLAFISYENAPDPFPEKWIPAMPDLAVEVRSPSNTHNELREKARMYLRHGTTVVWIVMPATQSVEVWRKQEDGRFVNEVLPRSEALSGEDILPGFELELSVLFA